ncbi:MAG: hypothetical protein JWL87_19 [Candidatus Adlerbacteria bacterium]|nr:hypothetical protein [Candidatus Adlerbacteria bacterium]
MELTYGIAIFVLVVFSVYFGRHWEKKGSTRISRPSPVTPSTRTPEDTANEDKTPPAASGWWKAIGGVSGRFVTYWSTNWAYVLLPPAAVALSLVLFAYSFPEWWWSYKQWNGPTWQLVVATLALGLIKVSPLAPSWRGRLTALVLVFAVGAFVWTLLVRAPFFCAPGDTACRQEEARVANEKRLAVLQDQARRAKQERRDAVARTDCTHGVLATIELNQEPVTFPNRCVFIFDITAGPVWFKGRDGTVVGGSTGVTAGARVPWPSGFRLLGAWSRGNGKLEGVFCPEERPVWRSGTCSHTG